jgi:nuclear transport factor 2 (NTF2) superfamily protein
MDRPPLPPFTAETTAQKVAGAIAPSSSTVERKSKHF